MSEEKKPSAAAMRASAALSLRQNEIWDKRLPALTRNEVATLIDAEFAPVVAALLKLTGAADGLFVGYPYLTECKRQAIAALAALEGK